MNYILFPSRARQRGSALLTQKLAAIFIREVIRNTKRDKIWTWQ